MILMLSVNVNKCVCVGVILPWVYGAETLDAIDAGSKKIQYA